MADGTRQPGQGGASWVGLPDPVDILTSQDLVLDFDGAMELARAYLDVDAREHAAAVAVRAGGSGEADVRVAGELVTALIHLAEGESRQAVKCLKPLDGFSDLDVAAEVFLVRGMAMEARGKRGDADANYRLAMGLPRAISAGLAAIRLAGMALATDDLDEAGRMLQAAMGCGVPVVTARAELELALLLERSGNQEAAIKRYRAAIDSPQQKTALHAAFNLAGLLRETGDSPEQLAESRHYLEQVHASGHPGYAPKAAVDLAVSLLEEERADEAVPLLEEGTAAADPAVCALAHFHLGIILIDAEQARRHLRTAQKIGTGEVKTRAAEALRLRRDR